MREEFKYNQLFAGEVKYITTANVAAGTYKRGTILASADGISYAPATEIKKANAHLICSEDVTHGAEGVVTVYKEGFFNKRVVAEANTEGIVTDDAVEILKTQNIFLEDTIVQ